MSLPTFPGMLAATGLLTLTLTLVASWLAVPWMKYASFVDGGPSATVPTLVLVATIATSLATLGWAVRLMRAGDGQQAVSFPHVLVVAALLGLGVVGALALWTAFFLSVVEWAEGFRLIPDAQPDTLAAIVARGLLRFPYASEWPLSGSPSSAYSGALVMQLVAVALPLALLSEGFRRMLRTRRNPGLAVEDLSRARLLVVLALLGLMVACAAAPMPIYSIIRTEGDFISTVAGELLMLAVGFAVPIASLVLVAVAHRRSRIQDSTWLPVVVALLVVAIASSSAADRLALPAVVGIPLAGLLWAALVAGKSERGPLSAGHLLGVVALIGLVMIGGATRGAVSTIEVGLWYEVTHVWLIVTMAITYAINLGILAAAVWRLRAESRREPAPAAEPEGGSASS